MGRKKKENTVYVMRREGWKAHFEVHVSPSARTMREHVAEIYERYGLILPSELDSTLGLVCPIMRLDSISGASDGLFAVMFVNMENCGTEILCHECLHVALAHERHVLMFGMDYGPECGEHEERLAYFLGAAMAGVVATLRENGHIA